MCIEMCMLYELECIALFLPSRAVSSVGQSATFAM